MEVKFTLSDQRYGRIVSDDSGLVGRKVALNWEVGDSPLNFAAVIDRVGAEIAAQRGGIDVYARVTTQPRGVELRPGAFVEASIPDKTVKASVKLPETALYDGDTVYVVENQRLVRRQVKLLAYMGAAVLVAGDLADGEAVLVTRIAEVGAGLKVRLEGQKRGPPRRPPGAPVSKSKDGGKDGRGA
jgi:multidrug efflux system membrane fusion protein